MGDLLELSARFIDGDGGGDGDLGPVNRVTLELSELADGLAMVESFSHVVAFDTGDGLVVFDATLEALAPTALRRIRSWSDDRVATLVYTHGHIDHVGGGAVIVAEAAGRGDPAPHVVAQEAVLDRFARYDLTNGYNAVVNFRQFARSGLIPQGDGPSFPTGFVEPDVTYRDTLDLAVGDTTFELHHTRGETDDHTWTWVPDRRAAVMGDLLIWAFPNAGNPQKVQRYAWDWARALREIAALEPELLLPAHGLPVGGSERVQRVLGDTAGALEHLVSSTLDLMNQGATLDAIVHTVRVPDELLERPYLKPVYDEPEFVVRNVWRHFGGWYDGNPARLKPPPDAELAAEVTRLSGGADVLAARALVLAEEAADVDGLRTACQLAEWALQAAPGDGSALDAARQVYARRRDAERSVMAKGIYGDAAERGR
jgi:alkyl sulfatase BDS1-like metallo-beta-lactamase superfamily hydrolase